MNKFQIAGCCFLIWGYGLMGVAFGGPGFLMKYLGPVAFYLPYIALGSMGLGIGLVLYGAKIRKGRPK
jgi:hypothetical protein